jgi:hypothetical protein
METKQLPVPSLTISTASPGDQPPVGEAAAACAPEPPEPPSSENPQIDGDTLKLAMEDVRLVLEQQQQLRQLSLTQLNILFVVNTALLTILSISRLIFSFSLFSLLEVSGFLLSFSLLIYALLPRPFLITPKLEDEAWLKRYLAFSPKEYQLQMLVNLQTVYEANKQRVEDMTQVLTLASYAVWATASMVLLHILITILGGSKP